MKLKFNLDHWFAKLLLFYLNLCLHEILGLFAFACASGWTWLSWCAGPLVFARGHRKLGLLRPNRTHPRVRSVINIYDPLTKRWPRSVATSRGEARSKLNGCIVYTSTASSFIYKVEIWWLVLEFYFCASCVLVSSRAIPSRRIGRPDGPNCPSSDYFASKKNLKL